MTDGGGATAVERAQEAASTGEWKEAFELLVGADADGLVGPADLPLLAEVAYAAGHLDVTIETWERAYATCTQAGEEMAAAGAAVRLAMHLLFDTALMAPVRGWLARAERLLDGKEDTPAHAWFAVVRTYERILTGDTTSAHEWARRAIDIGSARDPAACAIGRVAEARLLILDGNVQQGLALLDEAGVATVSGELDPLSTGVVFCELVCALQGLAQYEMAEEWTVAMERWCETNAIGSLHGRCRVHRAEILRLRGACNEAEDQALLACDELRTYLRRELGWPLNELGRIRLHKADLAGAEEAVLGAHLAGWDPQPVLALVRLAQGDPDAAAASIRDALERPLRVPSKERPPNTALQRAPLLEAQVEIEIAVRDLDRAKAAADELDLIAARFESKALLAGAALARGRVRLAEGDVAGAERSLSDSLRLWNEVGAPYEAAIARLCLADAHDAGGSEQQAELERRTARTILDRIEAARLVDRPPSSEDQLPASAGNVFRREGDHWLLVFDDRTARIRDLKGMHHLARLLAAPARELHVLDLVAGEAGTTRVDVGDAGEILDDRAKEAYRRRLAEIDEDIEQAQAAHDSEREAQADSERDFLLRELSRAVGLSGRGRRAGSASERARAAVTRAIRQAMARIDEHHPQLAEHLQRTIHTGTYCTYQPDPRTPTAWDA